MEKIFETIFQHSLDSIFIVKAKTGEIVKVNNRVPDLLGYSQEELIGKNFSVLFPSQSHASLSETLKETYAYDSVLAGQNFLCADGSTLIMDLTGIVDEFGGEKFIIFFLRNAKERDEEEKKLFFNNDLFNNMMENLPDYIYIKDEEERFIKINNSLATFLGIKPIRTTSFKNRFYAVPETYAELWAKEDKHILKTGEAILNRIDHLKDFKEGKDTWLLTTKVPIINSIGKIEGLVNISRDITSTKNEMEELARGEKLYSVLFDMSPIGILLEDENGIIMDVNKAYCETVGYTKNELIGMSISEFIKPESIPLMKENIKRILNGEILVQEVENIYHKKERRFLELREIKVTLANGKNGILVITNDITERKKTEQMLKHESNLLRNLMNNIPDTIYFKDNQSRFIRINAAQKKMLGLEHEDEANGKTDFEFFTKNHASAALIDEQNIIRTGKPLIGKLEHVRASDGNFRWVSATKVPLVSLDGSITGIVGISRDVTDMKLLEEEIRESEEKYRFLFEHSPIGFFIFDTDLSITQCNRRFAEILQSSLDKLIGLDMKRLNDKSVLPAIEKAILGEKGSYEGWYKATTSSASIYATIKTTPLYDTANKIIGGMGLVEDITESKKNELEIRKSENHFRSIWENSFDGMRVIDNNGIIRSVNRAFCEIVKMRSEELVGKHYSIIYAEHYREDFSRKGKENLKSKSIATHYEKQLQLWNNSHTWLEVINSFIEISDDENYLLSIFRNVGARKLGEEKLKVYLHELEELNKSKDKFFSIVAHDLKSPFQGLLGLSEILIEDYSEMSDEQIVQYLKIIRMTTKDVYRLIENLLDWSRLQSGRMEYKTEKLNLYQLSDGVLKLMGPTASKKNLQLHNSVMQSVFVYADMNMLNSILQNLVSNSVKFSNEFGLITIASEERNDFYEIIIADTGVGMDERDLSKLFKIDQHFSTKGTKDESGTGLGLLLCKELVEKHGGTIWAESQLGMGTKFHFTIPKA